MNILGNIQKVLGDLSRWLPLSESGTMSFTSVLNYLRGGVKRSELINEYKNLIYSCVSTLAEDVGRYEPIVYSKIVDGKPVPIPNHPLIKLLENPNNELSQFELFEATQAYIELTGEAFWSFALTERSRQPVYISAVLRPDRMTPVIEKDELIGYVYRKGDGKEVPFDVDEILHFKQFNPANQTRGYGPVEAGKLYIDIENETSLFQWGVLKNQASPSGVLSFSGKMTKEAFQKLKKQWKEEYGGTSNAGKTLFIRETDASFTKIGLSLSDLQISDMSKTNDEKIRKLFRISREMLGDTANSGLGRANIEALEYVHAKRVIEPKLIRIDDKLTTLLRRFYKETETRVSHVSHVPKDEASLLAYNDKAVDRWVTRNEIRSQYNLPSVDGGDKLYVGFNSMPIDTDQTQENAQSQAKTVIKVQECTDHNHIGKIAIKNKGVQDFFDKLERIENKSAKRFAIGLGTMLKEQEKKVIDYVERFNKKDKDVTYDGTIFDLSFTQEAIELNLLGWLLNAFMDSGEITLESLDMPDESFIMQQAQREAVFRSTERLMKSFNEQTALKIQQQLAQGLEKGETIEEITKRIESIYDEAKGFRAERIAETEVHKAVNYASAQAYKQIGYTELRWDANPGACEFCKAMDGKIVPMDADFVSVGGQVLGKDGSEYVNDYDAVKYADLHPNCKCRLRPVKA